MADDDDQMMDDDAPSVVVSPMHDDIYVCRECGADIAQCNLFVRKTLMKNYALFEEVDNVIAKRPTQESKDKFRIIYCELCERELGGDRLWVPNDKGNEGKFFVNLSVLALRRGRDFFDAVTEQRLDRNLQYLCWKTLFPEDLKDLGDDEYLFDCRACGNPIAAYREWIRRFFVINHYTVFGIIMNVTFGPGVIWTRHIWNRAQVVFCKTCGVELGFKVLSVTEYLGDVVPGRSVLYTKKLRLWKRGKMYNAVTGEPYYKIEQTFIMIKPDGVQRRLVGEIIRRFEKKGLMLKGLKIINVDRELAKKHYAHLSSAKKLKALVKFIVSGPVVAMVWEGLNAVFTVRDIIGDANPTKAAVGTIREDYGTDTTWNVIHGSDAVESAKKEIALWFPEGLSEWKSWASSWVNQ